MIRIASFLLSLALLFSATAHGADRLLVAEGDYVTQKSDGVKPLAHWKLWHLGNGEYEVSESSTTTNAPITQIFHFDAKFVPTGYSLILAKNLTAGSGPMSVSCKYGTRELRCDSEYKGKKTSASIPAKQPYVFAPGEFYSLDFAWFLTEIAQLAQRSKVKESAVNVYILTDSETNPDEIALTTDSPITLVLVGQETVQAMGKMQLVRKFEVRGLGDFSVLKVTSQGLVVGAGTDANPRLFGVDNYKEYRTWKPNQ
jgi:hypothetical protein